ncbi:hypothetical protein RsS62_27010 [Rhizobium dioscoreae]|nr:hypothetical protein RsS62_27010 [Rhizobium dioscoreae]
MAPSMEHDTPLCPYRDISPTRGEIGNLRRGRALIEHRIRRDGVQRFSKQMPQTPNNLPPCGGDVTK